MMDRTHCIEFGVYLGCNKSNKNGSGIDRVKNTLTLSACTDCGRHIDLNFAVYAKTYFLVTWIVSLSVLNY